MTLPVYIPAGAPDVHTMADTRQTHVKYTLLVDASGGPSDTLCQGIYHFDAGDSDPAHRHDIHETLHVLEGEGTAHLADKNISLAPGDTLFIPAGQVHGFTADGTLRMLFTFPVPRFADVVYHRTENA